MTGHSQRTFICVVGIIISAWMIVTIAHGSAKAEDDIEFVRYYPGSKFSNGPILHGFFYEEEPFFLLSEKDSRICHAKTTQQFIYNDTEGTEFAFEATRLKFIHECPEIESYLIAVHSITQPQYEPLPFIESFSDSPCVHYTDQDTIHTVCPDDAPSLYYQIAETSYGCVEFHVFDNVRQDYQGRVLSILLDGVRIDEIDIGWANRPPQAFLLNSRLFVRTYWNNEGGWQILRIHEVTEEGSTLLFTNDDFST